MPLNIDEEEKLKKFLMPVSPQPETPAMPELAPTDSGQAVDVVNKDDRISDSNPGNTADDLANYVQEQEAQIDKYGPDQEKAVMDSIIKDRGSLGRGVAHAGATLADGLMQGVAGAGNPGFAKQMDDNQNTFDTLRASEIPNLRSGNASNMAAKERLQGMTSSSPLGASQVAPYAAFFRSIGVPEKEISGMLANPAAAARVLEPFASVATAEQKAQMEMILKQLEMTQKGKQFNTQQSIDERKLGLEEKKHKTDAATEILKGSKNARFLGVPIPFTSDVSGKEADAARKTLMDQIDDTVSFGSEEEAKEAGLEDGTPVVINGVKGKWYN